MRTYHPQVHKMLCFGSIPKRVFKNFKERAALVPPFCILRRRGQKVYRQSRNYENLNRAIFEGSGPYEIPTLRKDNTRADIFVGFNYAKSCKDPGTKGLHFFVDDYQFMRLWTNPDAYIPMLQKFKAVCTPDFSLYTDFPPAIQIYNHYRKHWLGAYMQLHGIKIIPTIAWSDEDSLNWCFDGEPKGGSVIISSVGTQANEESKRLFKLGYDEMLRQLEPEKIYLYGLIPAECEDSRIERIPAFQERHRTVK